MSLILTLLIDSPAQAHFDALRTNYFPKHVNYLSAHLTLFHKLPEENAVGEITRKFCERRAFLMHVNVVKNIGNGVAFGIESPELQALHVEMQHAFSPWLISQDRNKLWPHITVQNKVTAFKALQTKALLEKDFEPFYIKAHGIASWRYLDGPWEKKEEWLFDAGI